MGNGKGKVEKEALKALGFTMMIDGKEVGARVGRGRQYHMTDSKGMVKDVQKFWNQQPFTEEMKSKWKGSGWTAFWKTGVKHVINAKVTDDDEVALVVSLMYIENVIALREQPHRDGIDKGHDAMLKVFKGGGNEKGVKQILERQIDSIRLRRECAKKKKEEELHLAILDLQKADDLMKKAEVEELKLSVDQLSIAGERELSDLQERKEKLQAELEELVTMYRIIEDKIERSRNNVLLRLSELGIQI